MPASAHQLHLSVLLQGRSTHLARVIICLRTLRNLASSHIGHDMAAGSFAKSRGAREASADIKLMQHPDKTHGPGNHDLLPFLAALRPLLAGLGGSCTASTSSCGCMGPSVAAPASACNARSLASAARPSRVVCSPSAARATPFRLRPLALLDARPRRPRAPAGSPGLVK